MKRRTTKSQDRARKKAARQAGMQRPGGSSRYGRKSRYLKTHGGWGFEYFEPKPWRSAS